VRWGIGWSISLVLIAIGLLWPLVFTGGSSGGPTNDPVTFSSYSVDLVVDADGNLDATETITAEFPPGRHGIFRHWDVANPNSPKVRQVPEVNSVVLDGRPASYQMLWEDHERYRVAKIGDPGRYLNQGTHVFQIRYTVDGVLDPGGTGADKGFASSVGDADSRSAFYWNVIAPAWNNRIGLVDVSVTLPGTVSGAQCSVGYGVGRECEDLTVSGNTVELSAEGLPPRTPVTLRAGVDVPTPPRAELPWSYDWDRILGHSLTGVLWVAGLTAAAALGAFLWYRTTVERSPGFPVQYAPPEGLGPVQCEYIRTESVPSKGITATLLHLAERRLVTLRQTGDNRWIVRGADDGGDWGNVDPVSRTVAYALKVVGAGAKFRADASAESGELLTTAKRRMATGVEAWALRKRLLKKSGERHVRIANVVALVPAMGGFVGWFGLTPTIWGLPFAAFFVFSLRSWEKASAPAAPPQDANCGRGLADSIGC
jgi:hypothetical protein